MARLQPFLLILFGPPCGKPGFNLTGIGSSDGNFLFLLLC